MSLSNINELLTGNLKVKHFTDNSNEVFTKLLQLVADIFSTSLAAQSFTSSERIKNDSEQFINSITDALISKVNALKDDIAKYKQELENFKSQLNEKTYQSPQKVPHNVSIVTEISNEIQINELDGQNPESDSIDVEKCKRKLFKFLDTSGIDFRHFANKVMNDSKQENLEFNKIMYTDYRNVPNAFKKLNERQQECLNKLSRWLADKEKVLDWAEDNKPHSRKRKSSSSKKNCSQIQNSETSKPRVSIIESDGIQEIVPKNLETSSNTPLSSQNIQAMNFNSISQSSFNRSMKLEEIERSENERKSKAPRIESIETNDIFEIVQANQKGLNTIVPKPLFKKENY